jgi:hypothetical protein
MTPLPTDLQRAIEQGDLTEEQLKRLIALEAEALGLSFEQALDQAKARTLPKNHLGADLELLIDLLPTAA